MHDDSHLSLSVDFDMTVLVYSGKEEEKDPVSKVHWQGKMECCTKRVLPVRSPAHLLVARYCVD
jgi:hypothetical protein